MYTLDPFDVADRIAADIDALPSKTTAAVRKVRREHSRALKTADAAVVIDVARALLVRDDRADVVADIGTNGTSGSSAPPVARTDLSGRRRWVAYELIRNHKAAFESVDDALLNEIGAGIDTWDSVDAFARTLSGPAWLHGLASDALIREWSLSDDLWWRRAALVSTVALNTRSYGGTGDTGRTLAICETLAADHEDMVVKALSWALRVLAWHDAAAVQAFLDAHDDRLAARVKREARNKLNTGLKNPRR